MFPTSGWYSKAANGVVEWTFVADPLFIKMDCLGARVPSIDEGLRFYCDQLGHRLVWRTDTSAGLAFRDAGAPELVLHLDRWPIEAAILVHSVPEAVERMTAAGGSLVDGPDEIPIGRLAVVRDPWNNHLVVLDTSKGLYETDSDRNVLGVAPSEP